MTNGSKCTADKTKKHKGKEELGLLSDILIKDQN